MLQAGHHFIGGFNQGQQFARRVRRADGGQIAFGSGLQLSTEPAHRTRGALHHDNDHQRNHGQQQRLAPQRVEQNVARQGGAQLQRFGNLEDGHGAAARAGDRLQQHRDARCIALVGVVVKIHQRGIRRLGLDAAAPKRQLGKTGHHLAAQARHPVVQAALVVGFKCFERSVGHGHAQLRKFVIASHIELLADRFRRRQQGAVIGGVDCLQCLGVQADSVDDDEQADGQQNANEQIPAQSNGPHAPYCVWFAAPPEGAAAPMARRSRFHGANLVEEKAGSAAALGASELLLLPLGEGGDEGCPASAKPCDSFRHGAALVWQLLVSYWPTPQPSINNPSRAT